MFPWYLSFSWRDLFSFPFYYFPLFAVITEEGFLISPCYSLELCIQTRISFLFSFAFCSEKRHAVTSKSSKIGIPPSSTQVTQPLLQYPSMKSTSFNCGPETVMVFTKLYSFKYDPNEFGHICILCLLSSTDTAHFKWALIFHTVHLKWNLILLPQLLENQYLLASIEDTSI